MSAPSASGFAKTEKFIDEEFRRLLLKKGRSYLVLEEILRFQAKGATIPVDLCHLGVLWVLDRCETNSCPWPCVGATTYSFQLRHFAGTTTGESR